MESGALTLIAWSYGLVGACYLAFSLRLLQLGYLRQPREPAKLWLFAAVALCGLWGGLFWLAATSRQAIYQIGRAHV